MAGPLPNSSAIVRDGKTRRFMKILPAEIRLMFYELWTPGPRVVMSVDRDKDFYFIGGQETHPEQLYRRPGNPVHALIGAHITSGDGIKDFLGPLKLVTVSSVPAMAHICSDTRIFFKEKYELLELPNDRWIYFDFEKDNILFPNNRFVTPFLRWGFPRKSFERLCEGLREVIVSKWSDSLRMINAFSKPKTIVGFYMPGFVGLERVTMVGVDPEEQLRWRDPIASIGNMTRVYGNERGQLERLSDIHFITKEELHDWIEESKSRT